MSITSISHAGHHPNLVPAENKGPNKAALKQLEQTVNAGNLGGARQAYTALERSLGTKGVASGPGQEQMAALSRALQSGDFGAARHALDALQSQWRDQGTLAQTTPTATPSTAVHRMDMTPNGEHAQSHRIDVSA